MEAIAARYLRFARLEAKGQSALYESLALHVARSPDALGFLAELPRERQQPNLLFAAVRLVAGTPSSVEEFEESLLTHGEAIANVMRTRVTQTNEPRRCAVLMPALASLKGPLALIEVGASAGLCLLPDAYGYDWGRGQLPPPGGVRGDAPIFHSDACPLTPLPTAHPQTVWRRGLELSPMDLNNDADVAWLEHLVWPEHHARLKGLRAAIDVAKRQPPTLVSGDLRFDLLDLISQAPADAHVVVYHTAVLSYLHDQAERDGFANQLLGSGATWISNEAPHVFPQFAPTIPAPTPGMFVLMVNGVPQAWTGPHGQSLRWLAP